MISLYSNDLQSSQPSCELSVSWRQRAPFMEGKSTPSGTQIDLLNWIAKEMDCRFIYKQLDWSSSLKAIKSGDLDFVGRASQTRERDQYAHFSDPYLESLMVLYVKKGTSKTIQGKSLEELLQQGFTIGLVKDAYYGAAIEKLRKNVMFSKNFIDIEDFERLQMDPLINGKVDGIFEAPYVMDNIAFKQAQSLPVEEYPLEIVLESFHFMFSKKSTSSQIVDRFNAALTKVRQSKAYKSHWFWSTIK